MSKLDELIAELCPDGVEFVTVEEICDITRGRVMSKNYLRENTGVYPVYSSQTANNGVFGYINTFDYDCESVTWTTDGANAGSVFYHINEKFSITNVCGLLRVKNNELVSTKFLFYVLQVYAKKYVNDGMGNPKLMSNVMARISVPLPPLPVQQEIVRILDNFTELTAELTTELTARRKQYEYYRDLLLTFGDDVPRLAISDLLIRTKGTNITAQKMRQLHKENGEVRIFAGGKTYADVDFKDIPKKDINFNPSIIVKSRGIIEFEYYDKPFSHKNEFWSYYSENKNVNIKFVYYYLSRNVNYFQRIANNMQMPQISIPVTDKYKVPLPPIKEQERIVSILDRFDALCNDLTSGLPAEIEARQKQYEYYRDKLLSFKEVTA